MSRIGKRPIPIPDQVMVTIDGQTITVKGSKGELTRTLPQGVTVVQADGNIVVERINDSRMARERHGLCRTLVANMVEGVAKGYERKLEIQGVGYRAAVQGSNLNLNMGYSHPVVIEPPAGIAFAVEANTNVTVSGIDKELVGNVAAKVRAVRPPEPYKGKGIRYQGEKVRRKVGKSGGKK
jgi:large subunit ribosomal protein L6